MSVAGPHNCVLGGGNENWPWDIFNAQVGSGSQCLFEGNRLDGCAYECTEQDSDAFSICRAVRLAHPESITSCGAFYTCGQGGSAWVNRGNVIRNSTFTNIGAAAVYLDGALVLRH